MQVQSTARETRLIRGGGPVPPPADPYCDVSNLLFRPRAGNVGGDTRAGMVGR